MGVQSIHHLQQRSLLVLNVENHSKIHVLPIDCSPKPAFNISKVSAGIFPSLK
jgi:hypothetical protein